MQTISLSASACSEACRFSPTAGPHGLVSGLPIRSLHHRCTYVHRSTSMLNNSRQHLCCGSHQQAGRHCSSTVHAAPQQHIHSTSSMPGAQNQQQHQPLVQQQQQHSAPMPTAAAAAAAGAQRSLPFAALSRVLLTSSNANVFKSLAQRRQPVSGPMGVLLFLATLIAASFAAIRSLLMKRGKSCKTCRGFGLQRCRLCLGSGRVDWAAKLKHFDVCPLCMNRRFIVCAECGGHYHRPMFAHRRRTAGGAFEPDSRDNEAYQGPIVLNMAAAGAAAGGVTVVTSSAATPRNMEPLLSSMSD